MPADVRMRSREPAPLLRALSTNMLAGAAGKAVTAAAGLAVVALLTRHLGPEGFGQYRTALAYVALAGILANLGTYVVALRDMALPGADESRILGNAVALRLVAALCVLAAAAALAPLLPWAPVVLAAILIAVPGYLGIHLLEVLGALFQRRLRQDRAVLAESAGALLTLALTGCLVLLGLGVLSMTAAFSLGLLAATALAWRMAQRLQPFRPRLEPAPWRAMLTAGLPLAVSELLVMARIRGDTLILALVQPPEEVGLYGVAAKLAELAIALGSLFAGLMLPLLAAVRDDRHAFAGRLSGALDAIVIAGGGAAALCLAFPAEIPALVAGPAFAASAPAVAVAGLTIAVASGAWMLRFAVTALDRQRALVGPDAVAALLSLLLYLALAPSLSLLGAALGLLAGELSCLVAFALVLRRELDRLPVPPALAGATAAAALLLVTARVTVALGAPWLAAAALGGLVWLATLWLTGALPRELLRQVLRKSA